MLELKNVKIVLSRSGRELINDLNFTLMPGDKVAVIGEEGNGKSTLLRYIFDPDSVSSYCECSGSITVQGIIGYLPQMMSESELAMSIQSFLSGYAEDPRPDVLARLGISPELACSSRRVSTLSGGERVRLYLAHILMSEPDMLLLDEPTNDLDIDALEAIENFILTTELPVMFISHDETLIENVANTIIHIEQIKRKTCPRISIARSDYRSYMERRSMAFARQEQLAGTQRDEYNKQMLRWQHIYDRVEFEQRTISRGDPHGGKLLKKKMKSLKSQEKRLDRQKEDFIDFPDSESSILVRFDENVSLPAGKTVLDHCWPCLERGGKILSENISIHVSGQEHIGITGKNGAGKSTLLREIWELLRTRSDIRAFYMPQDYSEKLDNSKTPIEYLAENYSKQQITQARTFLGCMRFTHGEMTRETARLSGGQKAKILFLEMVLNNSNVLILDEPTRNFSPLSEPVVRTALSNFKGCIISVSHDRKYLQEVCTRVYELKIDGLTTIDLSER